jgi:hypothetical protein
MEWIRELQECLADGLYIHNLRRISECCERGLKQADGAVLPAYVIRSVVSDLHRDWDGQAVLVDEVRRVERLLVPALEDVVRALRDSAGPAEVTERLERLVKAWLLV